MQKYQAISREIFAIIAKRGQPVEGLSLDEAFVAIGETHVRRGARICRDPSPRNLRRDRTHGERGRCDRQDDREDRLRYVQARWAAWRSHRGKKRRFSRRLPVGRLWGIGPKMQARLSVFGIATIGDLAALDDARLRELFGSWWREVRDLARGIDRRPVEPERETKSISTEETFEYDVRDEVS